jgi:hypothetical protein
MLVRFDSDLIEALLLNGQPNKPTKPSFVTIMTEDGPVTAPFQAKYSDLHESIVQEAVDEMPDWLKGELVKGQIISMGREDYSSLPDSVIRLAEIMAP